MAAPKQIIDIPIAAGLNTKADPRAMQPPGLAVCEDVQFDELGGVQTRPQYQAITDSASNTIADIRRITEYGDELVAFSKDKLWSYASGDGLWTQRAEYLAVDIDEESQFVTTGEQYDCDRAELSGVTMYCWSEDTPSGSQSYVAAIDTVSGSVKMGRTALDPAEVKPKLLAGSTRIYLLSYEGGGANALVCRAYTPSDLSVETGNGTAAGLLAFDAIINPTDSTEVLVAATLTSTYAIISFQEDGTDATEATRTVTSDGAIAIAYNDTTTDEIAIVYTDTGQIKADFYSSAYASVANDVAVGTGVGVTTNQIAAVYQADAAKLRVFWSNSEGTGFSSAWAAETNTCTNAGADTEATLKIRCGLSSRAFIHDSSIYVWVVFAETSTGAIVGELQNTYFLLRSDGLIVSKAVPTTAGGYTVTEGHLPTVQDLGSDSWAWCGVQRRIVPLGQSQKGYAARSPRDISFTFDSDAARRTAVLGNTMYISGGLMGQYDGVNLVETGFHVFPWHLAIAVGAAGNPSGTFNYKQTYSWYNAKGDLERSTTATIATSSALSSEKGTVTGVDLNLTAKTGDAGEIAIEYWRQIDAAPFGAPFYLVSSRDPSATGDNDYKENDPTSGAVTSLTDNIADAALISLSTNDENGGLTLPNLSPPAASIIWATQDRLILAGIAGNPHRVVYSKLRGQGEVAAFNDTLFVDLPTTGGPITAIGFLNETLIIFKESAIYSLPGDGYDNNGGGQNYGPARLLDNDVGAISAEATTLTPKGILFKSSKGWFVLTQGWAAQYVGVGADAYDDDTIIACHSMDSQHQVRCVSSARTLIWDYLVDAWFVWTNTSVSATMWNNVHHYVNSGADGVLSQASTYSGSGDLPGLDIESAWIKTSGIQGFGLIRRILILGESLGACDLRVRVAYNYKETASGPAWVDDKTWTVSPTTVNGPLQLEHGPSRPKCESIKIRLTAQAIGVTTHPISQAINLTALSLEVALRKGAFAGLPAAQKQ